MKDLNYEKDNTIDVTDLKAEFQTLAPLIYRYSEIKAQAEHEYDLRKAQLDELKSEKYINIKSSGEKITEKNLEALIDIDPEVKTKLREVLEAKRDVETLKGYCESLRAKKDMLIQLGADSRKE